MTSVGSSMVRGRRRPAACRPWRRIETAQLRDERRMNGFANF